MGNMKKHVTKAVNNGGKKKSKGIISALKTKPLGNQ